MIKKKIMQIDLHSPIVASSAIRRASFRFLHVEDNVSLVLHPLIVVLITGGATARHATGYRDRRQRLLLLLLHVHPIPRFTPLQHARLLCHLDHQRLNPRCPPITTHVEHNMHYPY